MVSKTYRVLLISGDRTHQEGYAAAFSNDPRSEIVGVADEADVSNQRHEWNRAMAARYSVPYYDNLDEALAQRDVDLISVCPEIERRGRVILRCAGRGLPLFLDKPLAGTPEDISDIQAAVNGAGVPAQMYSFTSTPWARAAKEALQSGDLGDLIAVHAEVMFAKGRAGTAPGGLNRSEHEFSDRFTFTEAKRELFDLGIYPIVLCLWLADSPVKQVTAHTANYFFAEHAAADIEDFGVLTIEFENGVVGSAVGGRIGFYSHPKIGPHGITVSGTGGTKTFSAWDPHIEVFSDEPRPLLPSPHPEDPMSMWRSTQVESGVPRKMGWVAFEDETGWGADEMSSFLDSLDADSSPDVGVGLAASATEVVLAAYQSAARGRPVTL
ncbi:MAG: Gfo/Idh/MocA family oxidoreductase [Dehalococcoidia bacterium]|jgi:predicted dehydrogenase|nr:Gfo/Idh/MocA family oxidoreductase [Dehalococcoidia bacterium]